MSDLYENPLLTDWPLWRVALGTCLITVGAAGAAGGGIGGGGLYVPLLVIVIGFATKEAVAISQGCIVGAAIAHLILNAPKKHPLLNIPVIDYAALLVLEPMLLTGSLFGVMLNGMLPSVVILYILILVLSLGAYKTSRRALKISRSEKSQSMNDLKALATATPDVATNVEMVDAVVAEAGDVETAGGDTQVVVQKPGDDTIVSASGCEYIKWDKLAMVAGLWVIVCGSVLVRGSSVGENSFAGIMYCSTGFWCVTAAIPIIEIGFSALFGKLEIDRAASSTKLGVCKSSSKSLLDYAEVEWNWTNVLRYMVYAFVCGMLAGCLGIGGGLVLSPLLLELGFYPAVASGISGMAVLVTSTSALFAYGLANKVYWEFVILLMPLTFCSTLVGKILIDRYAERNNKQSAIIWSVAIFLMVCLIMLTSRGLVEVIDDPSFEFSSPCV